MNRQKIKFFFVFGIFFHLAVPPSHTQSSSDLLRIWPAYRPEECEWALRKFVCLRCLKNGHLYAQRIHFTEESRPIREHGCFIEGSGFFPVPEGRDFPVDF